MRTGLLVLLLLALPAAQACQVTPIVGFEFPERQPCSVDLKTGNMQGCEELPGVGNASTYRGYVVWEWDADQCTLEGGIAQGDMYFTFDVSRLNPAWMPVTFEPEELVVGPADYYNPTNITHDPNAGRTYSTGRMPFEVTFTHEREPTKSELRDLKDRDGAARFFLKVLAHGEGVEDSFGISQFTFNANPLLAPSATESPQDENAPGVPLVFALVAIAGMALKRRS